MFSSTVLTKTETDALAMLKQCLTKTETDALAMLKQCLTKTETDALAINKIKRNKRVSRESYSLLSTHPYGYLTSKVFFASFFVESCRKRTRAVEKLVRP